MAVVQVLQNSTGVWSKSWSHQKILLQSDNMAAVQVLQSSTGVWSKSWSHQKILFQCNNMAVVQVLQNSTGVSTISWSHQKILFQCDNMAIVQVFIEFNLFGEIPGLIRKFCSGATTWLYFQVLQSSTDVWSKSWSDDKILFHCDKKAVVQVSQSSTGV